MAKIKTSEKHTISSKDIVKLKKVTFKKFDALSYILNKENVLSAIAECLEENDFEGILEVVQMYLEALKEKKLQDKMKPHDSKQIHREADYEVKGIMQIAHSRTSNSKKC